VVSGERGFTGFETSFAGKGIRLLGKKSPSKKKKHYEVAEVSDESLFGGRGEDSWSALTWCTKWIGSSGVKPRKERGLH